MYEDKVVICQLGKVSGHSMANAMGLSVVLEVFMVSEEGDRVRGTCKEVLPVIEASDNG